jgi:hypothetical protein
MSTAQAGEPADTDAMMETAREAFSPIRRCKPAEDGTIMVCGSDTQENRLTPEQRDIAGVGRSTRDSIPPAPEAKAMSLDRLPYNWMGRDGILYPRAKPNPLLEHVKAMEAAREAEEAAEAAEAEVEAVP